MPSQRVGNMFLSLLIYAENKGAPICNTVLQHFSRNMVDAIRTTPQETLF